MRGNMYLSGSTLVLRNSGIIRFRLSFPCQSKVYLKLQRDRFPLLSLFPSCGNTFVEGCLGRNGYDHHGATLWRQ